MQLAPVGEGHHGGHGAFGPDVAPVGHPDRGPGEQGEVLLGPGAGRDAPQPGACRVEPADRGVAGEDVDLVPRGEVGVQEVVGVRHLRVADDARLVLQDLDVHGPPPVAQHQGPGAGERQAGQHVQRLGDAARGVQQVADGQVRRDARTPLAAQHEVEPDREAAAVEPQVAEQPGEAEHQGTVPSGGPGEVEDRQVGVQVAVEVDGLGEHRAGAVGAREGGAVAGGPDLPVPHDLPAQLEQPGVLLGDPGARRQPGHLLGQVGQGRRDRRPVGGDPRPQPLPGDRLGHHLAEAAHRVVEEGTQGAGEGLAVGVSEVEGRTRRPDEGNALAGGHPTVSSRETFGRTASCAFTPGHSPPSTL